MKNVPVFIKIEDYENVVKIIDETRSKLQEASEIMEKVEALKRKEDEEMRRWRQELDEAGKRLSEIDDKLGSE